MYNYGGKSPFDVSTAEDYKMLGGIFLLFLFPVLLVYIVASRVINILLDIYDGYYEPIDLSKIIKFK